jgi:hypothetical protein
MQLPFQLKALLGQLFHLRLSQIKNYIFLFEVLQKEIFILAVKAGFVRSFLLRIIIGFAPELYLGVELIDFGL